MRGTTPLGDERSTFVACVLLLVLVVLPHSARAHLYTQCPQPRQCRLWHPSSPGGGQEWQAGADGPVMQNPCGFPVADVPPTTLVVGDTFCFRVYEYVPHTGTVMKVDLSLYPEGPLGEPENFNVHLSGGFSRGSDESKVQAGTHGILITVPNVTCDRCTLRAEQHATDLEVYYWTCADVRIVPASTAHPLGSSDCRTHVAAGTCEEWVPVDEIPSMKVVRGIIAKVAGGLWILVLICVARANGLCCLCGKPTKKDAVPVADGIYDEGAADAESTENLNPMIPAGDSVSATTGQKTRAEALETLKEVRCWLPTVLVTLVLTIPAMILSSKLETCSYSWDQDWENA